MLAGGRPNGSVARARLQSLTPRWVPSEADIDAAARAADYPPVTRTGARSEQDSDQTDGVAVGRHTLPDAPRPAWRVDAAAARGLLSLALAAAAGALVMVVVGWPRGTTAQSLPGTMPDQTNVLVDASPSASAASDAVVVVDVDGKVKRPGVVELPQGSRVIDAIKAAGGLTGLGDTGSLNLAEVLLDGQQVVVPPQGADNDGASGMADGATPSGGVTAPTAGATATVSINSAATTELETLPGVGPVLAAAIVQWRTDNGGFTSIEQLQEVSGIGPVTYAELAPLVRL